MSDVGQKLINEVRNIAAANPDFVYVEPEDALGIGLGCLYVHKGRPSCLIGQALWSLGYIDAEWEHGIGEDREQNNVGVDDILVRLGLKLDEDEVAWLGRVQQRQDSREPWGHCVGIS